MKLLASCPKSVAGASQSVTNPGKLMNSHEETSTVSNSPTAYAGDRQILLTAAVQGNIVWDSWEIYRWTIRDQGDTHCIVIEEGLFKENHQWMEFQSIPGKHPRSVGGTLGIGRYVPKYIGSWNGQSFAKPPPKNACNPIRQGTISR